jgi:threonyl-tRNA synthetase
MLIIGDRECQDEGLTPRLRSGKNLPFMKEKEFIQHIQEEIRQRR